MFLTNIRRDTMGYYDYGTLKALYARLDGCLARREYRAYSILFAKYQKMLAAFCMGIPEIRDSVLREIQDISQAKRLEKGDDGFAYVYTGYRRVF